MTDSLTQTQGVAQPVEYLAALDTRHAQHVAAAELARRDMAQIDSSIAACDVAIVQMIADADADGLARKRDRRAALIRRLTAARELEELETARAGRRGVGCARGAHW